MKVKELIAILQAYDPDLMVIRSGYEGGVQEINHHSEVTIALKVNVEWYYGDHEVVDEDDKYEGHERTQAVYLE
jgi:hypothetical protein